GLRVVAGAVLASEGSLVVVTRNRRIDLRPERDGTTMVVRTTKVKFPVGARVEICFGPTMPCTEWSALRWAWGAWPLALFGTSYAGRSSPFCYDVPQFLELL